jgi:hypothetical protein
VVPCWVWLALGSGSVALLRARRERWLNRWLVLSAVPLLLVVLQLPRELWGLYESARDGRALTRQERLLYPTRFFGLRHPEVFARAAAVIPRDAGYVLVVGAGARVVEPGIAFAVPFARYWLYPRRPGLSGPGSWILDWGTKPQALGLHGRVVELALGIWAVGPPAR